MCLGVPMQVLGPGLLARCRDRSGREHVVDLLLVGEQPAGIWVLTHLGAAREVIDDTRARHIGRALEALAQIGAGHVPDLDAAFGDLLGRDPELPEFLKHER
ncbi:MAG: HypC/HybG/HupF family hydrogenase formation chaperone [Rhodocyclaceae bacterium]|nr:HypC/HybG/HupF family hydrogenase formation chaperone [Rhodocyclaceae bacterium]